MATTTPTAETNISAPHKYNDLIRETATKHALEVNDLYETIASDIPAYICPDKIHLTPEGTELAASQVAACIEKYL
jgi:lysophospholipase L1-like esterase